MDEKTIQRIKKLQALAERGVGGEKDTAEKMGYSHWMNCRVRNLSIHCFPTMESMKESCSCSVSIR